ncbi:MAG: metal-dependent transcriptional regulator [Caldilineaceae bacterium]|nr:metal-dependent transcriptional regulator [Caldilineaceae bacterium]
MQTFCGLTTDGMLDYLAAIYKLDKQPDRVTTGALAARMSVSAAAVSSMLKRLEEGNFVERSNADGILLTEQGRLAALQLIRRHRLLEVFLIQVMGYSWDQVDVEAHALQHSISAAFVERMDALCGYPTHCPHGDPIPTKDGVLPKDDLVCLLTVTPSTTACIRRVATDDSRILRYLARLGLMPGTSIALHDIAPFNGPVTIERLAAAVSDSEEETRQILGHELAGLIFVEPVQVSQPLAIAV